MTLNHRGILQTLTLVYLPDSVLLWIHHADFTLAYMLAYWNVFYEYPSQSHPCNCQPLFSCRQEIFYYRRILQLLPLAYLMAWICHIAILQSHPATIVPSLLAIEFLPRIHIREPSCNCYPTYMSFFYTESEIGQEEDMMWCQSSLFIFVLFHAEHLNVWEDKHSTSFSL